MGLVYSLVAVGLNLIYGVMDVLNFAHGEFLMLSMYICFWFGFLWKIDPVISWIFASLFTFLLGLLVYKLLIRKVVNAPALASLLATFGLSIFLRNLALYLWGPNYRFLNKTLLGDLRIVIGGVCIGAPQVFAGVASIVVTLVIYFMIRKTKLGWAIQATALDREAAQLMGIDTEKIFALTFGIGGACVGVAGGMLSSFYYVFPEVGVLFSLIAFVSVALGGFGSIGGAFWAGIIIGLAEGLGGFLIAPVFKYVIVFVIYLLVVFLRPRGLFGW
ncbi:MAG: branched-chain amino acid transport system permease protein [bacterium]|nr:MAG: Amino acid/amide ABC transporter membrane protein 1, HAAT family [bacterium 42_11]MDK2870714.1 branched-chain amino acid transport system permease protein [bacterium]